MTKSPWLGEENGSIEKINKNYSYHSCKAVFYSRKATATMIDEVRYILDNAKKVGQGNKPQIPVLLFISNGKGTGWDKKTMTCRYVCGIL